MAKLLYANAQSTDPGPCPKSVGGWLVDALMLSLATQSLWIAFLPFPPLSWQDHSVYLSYPWVAMDKLYDFTFTKMLDEKVDAAMANTSACSF